MIKKRGAITDFAIYLILALIVIGVVVLFVYRLPLVDYFKNLPSFGQDKSQKDEVISGIDADLSACKDIGRFTEQDNPSIWKNAVSKEGILYFNESLEVKDISGNFNPHPNYDMLIYFDRSKTYLTIRDPRLSPSEQKVGEIKTVVMQSGSKRYMIEVDPAFLELDNSFYIKNIQAGSVKDFDLNNLAYVLARINGSTFPVSAPYWLCGNQDNIASVDKTGAKLSFDQKFSYYLNKELSEYVSVKSSEITKRSDGKFQLPTTYFGSDANPMCLEKKDTFIAIRPCSSYLAAFISGAILPNGEVWVDSYKIGTTFPSAKLTEQQLTNLITVPNLGIASSNKVFFMTSSAEIKNQIKYISGPQEITFETKTNFIADYSTILTKITPVKTN